MCGGLFDRIAGKALAMVLCFAMASSLSGCKPTDFFTEVVITPFSDVVDEGNPDTNVINSPDAQKESGQLAALEWTDESEQSEKVNKLVVYSSTPNTDMETHHSIFDLSPLLPGVESSDGVRLFFNPESARDEENSGNTEEEPEQQLESESVGGLQSRENASDNPSDESAQAQVVSEGGVPSEGASGEVQGVTGAAGSQGGSQPQGNSNDNLTSGEGNGDNEGKGSQDDPYAGYNGTVNTYNPGDAFQEVQHADSIAVLGSDVAVLAQAIGGKGAICAMSANAYWGVSDSTTASNFREVFGSTGDIDTADFEANRILWRNDGSSPSDLVSISALVSACGQGGVIVYDQRLGNENSLFSYEQRRELYAAGIMLVPVDLSTVQGIFDAASAIGDALSESSCVNDAKAYAAAYKNAVSSIVRGAANTRGGTLAGGASDGLIMPTNYADCPVKEWKFTNVYGYVATGIDTSLWSAEMDEAGIDLSCGVLFARSNPSYTPLFFWMSAAGVIPSISSAESTKDSYLLWPLRNDFYDRLSSSRGGTYEQWLSSGAGTSAVNTGLYATSEVRDLGATGGLGSEWVPYLVVSGTGGMEAQDVKENVASSVDSYRDHGMMSLYSAYEYSKVSGAGYGNTPLLPNNGQSWTTIGATFGHESESPFYAADKPLSGEQVVRANPCGLLGSWTEGSMESVLEVVWLTDLYSRSPEGCEYEPVNNMSQFSCNIGGYECNSTAETVQAFYQVFYRLNASNAAACYAAAVPDQLQDL